MKKTETTLFETIRIEEGVAAHLSYHNARLNQTRKALYGTEEPIDLGEYLQDIPPKGLYRAKVIYDKKSIKPFYYIYKPKIIEKIKLIEAEVSYAHKYLDREALERLLVSAEGYDEILITQNGYLTDTSIANIALRQDGIWYTPTTPLLPGTTRARLIDEGKIIPRDIHHTELPQYQEIALMNAMTGFSTQKHPPHSLISPLPTNS
jgi:4-amino-4-deoxychorismate lyase